jgi:hypothetical protein
MINTKKIYILKSIILMNQKLSHSNVVEYYRIEFLTCQMSMNVIQIVDVLDSWGR